MSLPRIEHKTDTVILSDGSEVTIRGLSRGEALKLAEHGEDVATLEVDLITFACDVPKKDAAEWHRATPAADVQLIVDAVIVLSGLGGDAGKATSVA